MTRAEKRAWLAILLSLAVGAVGHRLAPLQRTPSLSAPPDTAAVRIDLNTATVEELLLLPGVGPARAREILAHRPYRRVEDLLKVPGIGVKTLERLRPYVRVDTIATTP